MAAYNIHAVCDLGPVVSRRVIAQRAVKQARDYRRLGYLQIRIVDVLTGEQFDARSLAATLPAPPAPASVPADRAPKPD